MIKSFLTYLSPNVLIDQKHRCVLNRLKWRLLQRSKNNSWIPYTNLKNNWRSLVEIAIDQFRQIQTIPNIQCIIQINIIRQSSLISPDSAQRQRFIQELKESRGIYISAKEGQLESTSWLFANKTKCSIRELMTQDVSYIVCRWELVTELRFTDLENPFWATWFSCGNCNGWYSINWMKSNNCLIQLISDCLEAVSPSATSQSYFPQWKRTTAGCLGGGG